MRALLLLLFVFCFGQDLTAQINGYFGELGVSYAENREKGCSTELQLQPWRLIYQDGSIAYEPLAEQVEVQP